MRRLRRGDGRWLEGDVFVVGGGEWPPNPIGIGRW